MVLYLPNGDDSLAVLEEKFDVNTLKKGPEVLVNVHLPKFEIETSINLQKVLTKVRIRLYSSIYFPHCTLLKGLGFFHKCFSLAPVRIHCSAVLLTSRPDVILFHAVSPPLILSVPGAFPWGHHRFSVDIRRYIFSLNISQSLDT